MVSFRPLLSLPVVKKTSGQRWAPKSLLRRRETEEASPKSKASRPSSKDHQSGASCSQQRSSIPTTFIQRHDLAAIGFLQSSTRLGESLLTPTDRSSPPPWSSQHFECGHPTVLASCLTFTITFSDKGEALNRRVTQKFGQSVCGLGTPQKALKWSERQGSPNRAFDKAWTTVFLN